MADTAVTRLLHRRERAVAIAVRGFAVECVAGPDAGRTWRATRRSLSIGSHASADVELADPHVSRLHARVDVEGQEYVLRDLGSTNGTFAGGVKIREAALGEGARVDLGHTQLIFHVLEEGFEIPLADEDSFEGLIGRSVAMRELFDLCARIAPTEATILVEGETGTGKELVARALHRRSRRAGKPFVVFDCGAVPASLIESELFGHERGAFTGATASRAGVFERADGGTLFIDELGELALELQPKLLRALETGEITRVGGEKLRRVDVRVVAATHRDLPRLISEQRFRADLYYRLAVIRLEVPPLRARRDDIPLLAAAFARDAAVALPEAALTMVFERYRKHDWPGNVRELRNAVERALVGADVSGDLLGATQSLSRSADAALDRRISLREARDAADRDYLARALAATDGDVAAAAELAQVHPKSFERLLRKYRLR